MPIADEAGHTFLIQQYLGRQAPEFEQVDLLTIQFQDSVLRVRQASEGQVIFPEVPGESRGILWTDHKDVSRSPFKLGKVLAQLRHMRAAERSDKTAVENQQDEPATEVRKVDGFPADICQFKIGRGAVDG
jgi:hypothetical protein